MRYLFLVYGVIFTSLLTAQSRKKITYGASLNPVVTVAYNHSSSDRLLRSATGYPQTHQTYIDSVAEFETYKLSLGATGWVTYLWNRNWSVQAGLGYNEVGFTRKQENIRFNDVTFPGIGNGRITDLTNIGSRSIEYRFRYQYLTVPIVINRYLKRSGDYRWDFYLSGGIGLNVLLQHQLHAVLKEFTVDGETAFKLDSTGFEGRRFTAQVFLGGRFDYQFSKEMSVFAQPMLTVFPLSVSGTDARSNPIGIQCNIGIIYDLKKKEDSNGNTSK